MKNLLILFFAVLIISACDNEKVREADKSNIVILYHKKDGVMIQDTVILKDTTLINEFNQVVNKARNNTLQEEETEKIYDEAGRLVIKKATSNEKSLFSLSYTKYSYDQKGNLIKEEHFDDNNKLVNAMYDIATDERKYDLHNNCIEIRYFDKDHNPAVMEEGPHVIRTTYNKHNQELTTLYLDIKERPLPGFTKVEYVYDSQGKLIEEISYDDKDKEIRREKK